MGLLSLLGKAAVTIATNLDKVDSASEIANVIPDKINQVKDIAGKAKDLYLEYEIKQTKKAQKAVHEMQEAIGRWDAKLDGLEYDEIARRTGLSQVNIRVLISMARKTLKKRIVR